MYKSEKVYRTFLKGLCLHPTRTAHHDRGQASLAYTVHGDTPRDHEIQSNCSGCLPRLFESLGKEIDTEDVAQIKELRDILKAKFAQVESKWEALSKADIDPFKDQEEHDKCQEDYENATFILEKYLKAAKNALDRARDQGTATQEGVPTGGGGGSGAIKIDEILKPKELLSSEMNLEEADQWFDSYRAYISFNQRNMTKLEVSVRRQLLNKCLDPKMVSALRTHNDITPTTEINAPNGCLAVLRAIFLEKKSFVAKETRLLQMRSSQGRDGR